MNEFAAKKLGEVLAFARVGSETFEKAGPAYEGMFGESYGGVVRSNEGHASELEAIANEFDAWGISSAKAEKTAEKLRSMRAIYLADEADWSNPSELLEWSGFFEGAALVHWKLVSGIAEKTGHPGLALLAKSATAYHEDLLAAAGVKLATAGRERS